MTPLQLLRANQHEHIRTQSDAALEAFLAQTPASRARLDLTPTTETELRHLTRTRNHQ